MVPVALISESTRLPGATTSGLRIWSPKVTPRDEKVAAGLRRGPAAAGDDAGHVRPVAVVVIRAGLAVDQVDPSDDAVGRRDQIRVRRDPAVDHRYPDPGPGQAGRLPGGGASHR